PKSSQTEYIYWNPRSAGICSWQFDSSGGTSRSTWELNGGTWTVHSSSIQSDGAIARADYIIKEVDKDNFVWQSKRRSLSGVPLPDTEQIKVTRDKG
ncbi:MAG: hypothetical protein K2X81_14535, partial [Candidatus Obscuribacterales bacterium]|nr:hypothetical protein [Candidatus Obscuribacterales bacterium]